MFLLIRVALNVFAVYYGITIGIIAGKSDVLYGILTALAFVLLANMIFLFIVKEHERYHEWRESRSDRQV